MIKHNKIRFVLVSITLIIIIAGVLLLTFNSFSGVINRAGFNSNNVIIHFRGFDNNGDEYKIIQSTTKEDDVVLARMVRNKIGFWSCYPVVMKPGQSMVSISWMNSAGIRRFGFFDEPVFETEWHNYYYGNDAIKLIEFQHYDIPNNVTINIQQFGNEYWIHVVTYADPQILNDFDLRTILITSKCVESVAVEN